MRHEGKSVAKPLRRPVTDTDCGTASCTRPIVGHAIVPALSVPYCEACLIAATGCLVLKRRSG